MTMDETPGEVARITTTPDEVRHVLVDTYICSHGEGSGVRFSNNRADYLAALEAMADEWHKAYGCECVRRLSESAAGETGNPVIGA